MDVVLVVLLVIMSVAGMAWIHRRQSGAGFVARALTRATAATVDSASGRVGTSVALTGVVRAGAVVSVSAATGRAYVARDLRLRPFDGASASSTRSACEAVDFLLEDDTGVAFVRAGQAMVVLPRDVQAPTTTLDQAPWAMELLRQTGYHTGSPQQCRVPSGSPSFQVRAVRSAYAAPRLVPRIRSWHHHWLARMPSPYSRIA